MKKIFFVTFKVHYETKLGEKVYVSGGIEELGRWQGFKKPLKWTEGHFWMKTYEVSEPIFEYKYVVINETTQEKRWESGPNRTCDLNIISKQKGSILNDQWEHYRVHFMIYFPLQDKNEYMRINGDPKQLGNWNKTGPLEMKLGSPRKLPTGEVDRCWEREVVLPNSERDFEYKYSIYNSATQTAVWEREPSRKLTISNKPYPGSIKAAKKDISDVAEKEVYVVNGGIEKMDVNFVAHLNFDEIPPYDVFIGPYPQHEQDIQKMVEGGVTGVFNIQTSIDMKHREVDWPRMLKCYQENGVRAENFQIHDFNQEHLIERLEEGAALLKEMVEDEGRKVYVHCTAGMGRAPAIVVAYLCIYKGLELEEADRYVKQHRKVAVPNKTALRIVLDKVKEDSKSKKDHISA